MAYTCSDCTITDCPNQGCDYEGCDELDLTPQEPVAVVLDPLELRIAELEKNWSGVQEALRTFMEVGACLSRLREER